METSKFQDDYTQYVYVVLNRKPGKRFLSQSFSLSYDQRPQYTLVPRKMGIWGAYSKLVRRRFYYGILPSRSTMDRAKRLMRLAYHMEEEYPK